ncbi:(2Fe-2S) ferredoxin domain-containing protein [Algoriphagus sp.]|uniref:(2Fe-2S) ferredoxin domain-containing protein n=1 Tax=Algoriphagus sp. TaxID=1872435 RepID=UPI0025E9B81E|nr:(2Fe-2S) ferredoxin domain-containing protein [Algoriphagus sp.]
MESKRKLIFICQGSDCKKSGSKSLNKKIKEEINSKGLKGQFKLIKTKCMDCCKSAPVVIIGEYFCKKATFEKVISQIKKS